jgi:hypothetical protein
MRVSYGRLYSLGNFENEKIEFEDSVQPGESYEEAYERARAVVDAEHTKSMVSRSLIQHERDQLYKLRNELADKERRLREVNGSWRRAAKNFDRLRELLAKHGVELPDLDEYQRPPKPQPEPGEFIESSDQDDDDSSVMCPHCFADITGLARTAYSGPEPECEPGSLCPRCREFIADE